MANIENRVPDAKRTVTFKGTVVAYEDIASDPIAQITIVASHADSKDVHKYFVGDEVTIAISNRPAFVNTVIGIPYVPHADEQADIDILIAGKPSIALEPRARELYEASRNRLARRRAAAIERKA